MFNLLNIQKKQQQGAFHLDDEKVNNKSGKLNSNEKHITSQHRQVVSQGMSRTFYPQQQVETQNVYLRAGTGYGQRQMIQNQSNSVKHHSSSSHQLQRLSSALKVQGGSHIIYNDGDEDYDYVMNEHGDQMPVLNNAFPNFPNKFKKERIASAIMSQKYIKKLGPRPETSNVNQTQQMQQKYMDMFNQPKNLFNQVLSIQDTQNQSKKFFTENRTKTATTRSQTHKEVESLADIKDFKQIMQENVSKRQQEGKNAITFATIDRARTANELYRKQSLKKQNQDEKGLEHIEDVSENQSKSGQVSFLPRAETAQLGNIVTAQQLQKEIRFNGDVHSHLKKHMLPKSQQNLAIFEKAQSSVSLNQKQPINNNFVNDTNQEGVIFQQQKINASQPIPETLPENSSHFDDKSDIYPLVSDNIVDPNQRKNVRVNLDQAMKEKLKIDLSKHTGQQNLNAPSSAMKSPSYSNTPKSSHKGVVPHKQSKLSISKNNNPSSLTNIPGSQDYELPQSQKEEMVFRLNLKSNTLTKGELNYIIKKRKYFQSDLQPHMESIQQQFEKETENTQLHGSSKKQQITFSVLDQPTIVNLDNPYPSQTQQFLNTINKNGDYIINQQNIAEPEKCFYDHPNNIHDQLKDYGEELREKFDKYHEEDQLDFQRFQQKKEQFVYNFLNTNEESVSQHELNLIMEEYKLPPQERDYEFLDTIAERLKFFKRFTKPTRLYLLKLANIAQYPANEVIFNQGDEGDLMYVIVRGACHVRIKRMNPDGKEDNLVVATLYDGQQFGELALMNAKKPQNLIKSIKANEAGTLRITQIRKELEKQPLFNKIEENENQQDQEEKKSPTKGKKPEKKKSEEDINKMLEDANKSSSKRAATIETCEVTTLFTVSREYFKTILLGLIQKELDVKLKLLQTLTFFEYMDPVSLIPLANLVEVKKYKLGEILVREGQEPNDFFIVSSGRLKILKEEVIVRSNFVMGREHKFSTDKLKFGMRDYTKVIPEGTKIEKEALVDNTKRTDDSQSDSEEEGSDAPQKAANFEIIYSDDQNIAYQYQHEFGSLVRGDFFMGRAILWEYLKVDPAAEDEYQSDPREKAKLTVIADSAETEVYILEKDKIHLIPNLLRRTMIDGLITRKEFDAVYTKEVSQWSKQWDKYKSNVLEQIKVENIYKKSLK